jgi:prophage maintenance system killer protein
MAKVLPIELADFLLICEDITGIDAENLGRGFGCDIAAAESALAAPHVSFGDFEPYPTIGHQAAIYCSRIIRNHPLTDGNKRAGWMTMRDFLLRNGHGWAHDEDGQQGVAQMIEDLAAHIVNEDTFMTWVTRHVEPS